MRVILADTQRLLRDALRVFLCRKAKFEVVGETADGLEALSLVESLHPDVFVLDLALATMDGIQVIERLREGPSQVRIVVLSDLVDARNVAQSLQAGADAYVSKRSSGAELLTAIHSVGGGKRYLSEDLRSRFGSVEEASRTSVQDQ